MTKDTKNDLGADAAEVDKSMAASADTVAPHAAHTPGPWKAVNRRYRSPSGARLIEDWRVEDASGDELFEVFTNNGADEPVWYPTKANAHLIAAAPELLDSLKLAVQIAESWIHDQLDGTGSLDGALAHLKPCHAAIAKAEGR